MSDPAKKVNAALSEMEGIMAEKLREGGSVSFSPKGSSMLPMLRSRGDSVTLAKPPARMKRGMVALFISGSGDERKYVLHRLVRIRRRRDEYVFCGDKRETRDAPVRRADIVGVVTDFTSRGKKYDMKEPSYRLYSAWMVATQGVRPVSLKVQSALYRAWRKIKG